jgi:hypothetical protein
MWPSQTNGRLAVTTAAHCDWGVAVSRKYPTDSSDEPTRSPHNGTGRGQRLPEGTGACNEVIFLLTQHLTFNIDCVYMNTTIPLLFRILKFSFFEFSFFEFMHINIIKLVSRL